MKAQREEPSELVLVILKQNKEMTYHFTCPNMSMITVTLPHCAFSKSWMRIAQRRGAQHKIEREEHRSSLFIEALAAAEKTSYACTCRGRPQTRTCLQGTVLQDTKEGIIMVHECKGRLCRELSIQLVLACSPIHYHLHVLQRVLSNGQDAWVGIPACPLLVITLEVFICLYLCFFICKWRKCSASMTSAPSSHSVKVSYCLSFLSLLFSFSFPLLLLPECFSFPEDILELQFSNKAKAHS